MEGQGSDVMKIDWFTIGAQAINFLILVWLLKHFLYKPILQAIAAREKRIASELADAKAKKEEAQKEHDEFNRKNSEFDKQRTELLAKATDEATAQGQRLLDEARKAATALRSKLQEAIDNDAVHLNQAIGRRIEQEVFSIARKVLTDLAGASLEDLMVSAFIQRLKQLSTEEKRKLLPGGQSSSPAKSLPSIIRSSFNLKDSLQEDIESAIKEVLSTTIPIQFETDPALVSGIEFTSNGQKLAWSISNYLSSLKEVIDAGGRAQEPKVNPKLPDNGNGKAVDHVA
jgi:F-type H+-transporting ATPase subunit b